jgi:hypothetical protein
MRSVMDGNVEMCKLLIDNGALSSINTPDNVNISDVIKSYVNICIHVYKYIYST